MLGATHIAQFNWGILLDDWGTATVADFENNLDRVNAVADRSEGFVWRMTNEAMEASHLDPDGALNGNPRIASTLSVWKSSEALINFVHKTIHGAFLKRRQEWFEQSEGPRYVIWDVPVGHVPTLAAAVKKLDLLATEGPSDLAYDFTWLRRRAVATE